jgi:hypothetical protein
MSENGQKSREKVTAFYKGRSVALGRTQRCAPTCPSLPSTMLGRPKIPMRRRAESPTRKRKQSKMWQHHFVASSSHLLSFSHFIVRDLGLSLKIIGSTFASKVLLGEQLTKNTCNSRSVSKRHTRESNGESFSPAWPHSTISNMCPTPGRKPFPNLRTRVSRPRNGLCKTRLI